jgi:hypothetical protein
MVTSESPRVPDERVRQADEEAMSQPDSDMNEGADFAAPKTDAVGDRLSDELKEALESLSKQIGMMERRPPPMDGWTWFLVTQAMRDDISPELRDAAMQWLKTYDW